MSFQVTDPFWHKSIGTKPVSLRVIVPFCCKSIGTHPVSSWVADPFWYKSIGTYLLGSAGQTRWYPCKWKSNWTFFPSIADWLCLFVFKNLLFFFKGAWKRLALREHNSTVEDKSKLQAHLPAMCSSYQPLVLLRCYSRRDDNSQFGNLYYASRNLWQRTVLLDRTFL